MFEAEWSWAEEAEASMNRVSTEASPGDFALGRRRNQTERRGGGSVTYQTQGR